MKNLKEINTIIDAAIENAYETSKDIPKGCTDDIAWAIINIDGCKYKILNDKQTLIDFKKRMQSLSYTTKKTEKKAASIKPTHKRICGEGIEYYLPYTAQKQTDFLFNSKNGSNYHNNNGYYMNNVASFIIRTDSAPAEKENLRNIAEELRSVDFFGAYSNELQEIDTNKLYCIKSELAKNPLLHVRAYNQDMYFNVDYVDSILTQYPDVKMYINKNICIVCKNNGVFVACFQGMKNVDTPSDRLIKKITEIHGAKETETETETETATETVAIESETVETVATETLATETETEIETETVKSIKSMIFITAWAIARASHLKHGGKVRAYFSDSLKQAWVIHKQQAATEIKIDTKQINVSYHAQTIPKKKRDKNINIINQLPEYTAQNPNVYFITNSPCI